MADSRLIELTGDDRIEWLQGQATNDLRQLAPEFDPMSFCLCEATGQIRAICDVWLDGDRLLVLTDDEGAACLMKRVETMVILEDVQAQDLGTLESGPVIDEAERIEAGIPKRGVDYTDKTLPPELGPAFEAKHVSYNKGCYMGQEVLMRMHSRGHTNRTWVGILLDEPVEVGAKVSHESRPDAGVITSAAVSHQLGPIAAAMLRNEAAQEGAEVRVGEIQGIVKNFPLN